MRKLWVFLAVMALALIFVAPAYSEFRWGDNNIGSNPLMPFSIENEQLLVQGLAMCQPQIGRGLSGRVPGDPFLVAVHLKKAVAAGQVQRFSFPAGTRFPFMISAGGINTDVVWIGPSPLEGFVVGDFFIPRKCGNLVPLPPRTQPPPQLVAPPPPPPIYAPPPMAAPPPPVCAPPPAPVYEAQQQPNSLGLGLGLSSWCGGGNNYSKATYISVVNAPTNTYAPVNAPVYAPVYAPTSTYAPTDASNRTYAPTTTSINKQSWSSQQCQPAPTPTPVNPYCPPGQPAGGSGRGSGSGGYYYSNAGNNPVGANSGSYGPTGTVQPVMAGGNSGGNSGGNPYGPQAAQPTRGGNNGSYGPTGTVQPVMAGGNSGGNPYGPQVAAPSGTAGGGSYGPTASAQPAKTGSNSSYGPQAARANYGPSGSGNAGGYGPKGRGR